MEDERRLRYEEAVNVAQKGFELDQEQTWINTNLALSTLLSGDNEGAIGI